jgi:hypothetical protein
MNLPPRIAIVSLCAACAGRAESGDPRLPGAESPEQVRLEDRVQERSLSPFSLEVREVPATDPSVRRFTLTIQTRGLGAGQVRVAARLPDGVRLVQGLAEVHVDASVSAMHAFEYEVAQDAGTPSEDVEFTGVIEGVGFGAVGRAFYRFGRPEPRLPPARLPNVSPSSPSPLAVPGPLRGARPTPAVQPALAPGP